MLEEDGEGAPPSPRRWDATFFPAEGHYRCPVPDCSQGGKATGCGILGMCGDTVSTYPHSGHKMAVAGKTCRQATAARRQHTVAAKGKNDLCHTFSVYDGPSKHVPQFKYLGCIGSYTDSCEFFHAHRTFSRLTRFGWGVWVHRHQSPVMGRAGWRKNVDNV